MRAQFTNTSALMVRLLKMVWSALNDMIDYRTQCLASQAP
jgi:uncharacterized membrane protein YpjA